IQKQRVNLNVIYFRSLMQLAVLTRPANDAGASTASQSGRTKGNAASRYLWSGKLKGVRNIQSMAITATSTVAMVREKFPQAVVETVDFRGEETIVLLPEHLVTVCAYLLKNQQYSFLSSVTAVDWLEREPRFDVVYHLLSIPKQSELRLKVRVGQPGEEHPSVPTVSGVWPGANWYEREVYDLFGVIFSGHSDLRRILMPMDWTTHPLRKDYPLTGFDLPEPHWG